MFDWTKKRAVIAAGVLEHYRCAELAHALIALGAQVEVALMPSLRTYTAPSAVVPIDVAGKLGIVAPITPGQLGSTLLPMANKGALDVLVAIGCAASELDQEADGLRHLVEHCGVLIVEPLGPGTVSVERADVSEESDRIIRIRPALGDRFSFVDSVLSALRLALGRASGDLVGVRLLVSAGGTRERIDPVRHIGNRASGKMGFQLAAAARDRGATVTVIAASPPSEPLVGVRIERAGTVAEMRELVLRHATDHAALFMAAALSDFRVENPSAQKIKKQADTPLVLRLTPNPNFITELPRHLLKVGFAAETENVMEHASNKRARRGFDVICANDVSRPDIGFDVDTNEIVIIDADGVRQHLARAHKYQIAHGILDALAPDIREAARCPPPQ
jgi:phosphopantothenoylcysteine decarboxylase/phosphopantothenate--cysteine ligase